MVVVATPCADQSAGVWQAVEQVLVQTLVPEPAVEALDEAVLHRLSRRDVVPFNLPLFLPAQDRVGCQWSSPGLVDGYGLTCVSPRGLSRS